MGRKKAEPEAPTVEKQLKVTLPNNGSLADAQQAISDLRAQGAPEAARLSIYNAGIYDLTSRTTVTVTWDVPR